MRLTITLVALAVTSLLMLTQPPHEASGKSRIRYSFAAQMHKTPVEQIIEDNEVKAKLDSIIANNIKILTNHDSIVKNRSEIAFQKYYINKLTQ